jgi:hypothetical protein
MRDVEAYFLGWRLWADEPPAYDIPVKIYREGMCCPITVRRNDMPPGAAVDRLHWRYDLKRLTDDQAEIRRFVAQSIEVLGMFEREVMPFGSVSHE